MKKFAVLLTLILVCTALTACGGEEDIPESSSDSAAAVGIVSGAEETGTPAETGSDPSTEPEATRAGSSAQQESPAQGEQTPSMCRRSTVPTPRRICGVIMAVKGSMAKCIYPRGRPPRCPR